MAIVRKYYMSSPDGRSSDEVMGSWGGDFGEMLLGLSVLESEKGRDLSTFEVKNFVKNTLQYSKQNYFYYGTDTSVRGARAPAGSCAG